MYLYAMPITVLFGSLILPLLFFMGVTNCCVRAWLYGNIAKRLGKNVWLHAVMAFFVIPLLVTIPIMAFDDSRPHGDAEMGENCSIQV